MNHYFTARVEINNHDDGDYTLLHVDLQKIGFYRAIKAGTGHWYDLPTGEYVRFSDNTLEEVKTLLVNALKAFIAKKPRNKFGQEKDYEFLLGKSEQLAFKLKLNTDVSKRPK